MGIRMARTIGIGNQDFETIRKDLKYEYVGKVFSERYAGRGELFEGLRIWGEEKYRKLQGTYLLRFVKKNV